MRGKAGAQRGRGGACPARSRVRMSCVLFARERGRRGAKGEGVPFSRPLCAQTGAGGEGGDVPPSCAAPCSRINGARGAKGGYALSRAVPCSHALFARERGGGRERKWGGGLSRAGSGPWVLFARERGQKGGHTFPRPFARKRGRGQKRGRALPVRPPVRA